MKKEILILLLLVVTDVAIAQITGGHIIKDKTTGLKEGYYFWEDGEFTWFRFLGNKKTYGRGTFVVDGNQIELRFGKARRQFDLASEESRNNGTSNSTIEVRAITTDGVPIQGLRVYFEKSGNDTTTNEIGYARIELINAIARDAINFEYGDYRTINATLTLGGRDRVYVISIDKGIDYVEFEDRTIKFVEPKGLIQMNNGREPVTFRKISKRKYLKAYHRRDS